MPEGPPLPLRRDSCALGGSRRSITVVGCGLLGRAIAGSLAFHSHDVTIYDVTRANMDLAVEEIADYKTVLEREGVVRRSLNYQGSFTKAESFNEACDGADFIFEAMSENIDLKHRVVKDISNFVPEHCIFSTNSLNFSVDDVSEHSQNRDRFLGVRFLYPVYLIPDVEVSVGRFTSTPTLHKVRQLMEDMGKTIYFRPDGTPPIILTPAQVDARRDAYKHIIHARGHGVPRGGDSHASVDDVDVSLLALTEPPSPDTSPREGHEPPTLPTLVTDPCASCHDAPSRGALLVPCHHAPCCLQCAKGIVNRGEVCPMCGNSVNEIIRIN